MGALWQLDEQGALRPIKLGTKKWLFISHVNAGPRTAMMFILVDRVDDHLVSRIEELTPHGWIQSKNS